MLLGNATFALLSETAFALLQVVPLLDQIAFRVRHQRPTAVLLAVEERATRVLLLAMLLAMDRRRLLRVAPVHQGLLLLMCSLEQRKAPSLPRLWL